MRDLDRQRFNFGVLRVWDYEIEGDGQSGKGALRIGGGMLGDGRIVHRTKTDRWSDVMLGRDGLSGEK